MNRIILFDDVGNIVVMTEHTKEIISRGTVLLTPEQVKQAAEYGWKETVSSSGDIEAGLRRVYR